MHTRAYSFALSVIILATVSSSRAADHEIYVLDVPQAAVESAPTVDPRNFAQTADQEWRRKLDQFWTKTMQR